MSQLDRTLLGMTTSSGYGAGKVISLEERRRARAPAPEDPPPDPPRLVSYREAVDHAASAKADYDYWREIAVEIVDAELRGEAGGERFDVGDRRVCPYEVIADGVVRADVANKLLEMADEEDGGEDPEAG